MNINIIQEIVEEDGIVFLTYGGFLSQALIASMTEALENEAEINDLNMGVANNIFTIFIEMSQNMMNYSKSKCLDCEEMKSQGLIIVGKNSETTYSIHSQNIINTDDKAKIEPLLEELKTMSKDEIKARYRELRRSGRNTHGKGGGIGFYEIAKRCDAIEFEFKPINPNKYYFHLIVEVHNK